jgi:DNA-binding NtrC family response regulator
MPLPLKCVVIDDEPDWLHIVERMLRKAKPTMQVIPFSRALDALEYVYGHPVHAIVTDLKMPELHGFLLIEAVRQFDPALPIILISIDESVQAESLACGATAFVGKSELKEKLVPVLARLAPPAEIALG